MHKSVCCKGMGKSDDERLGWLYENAKVAFHGTLARQTSCLKHEVTREWRATATRVRAALCPESTISCAIKAEGW